MKTKLAHYLIAALMSIAFTAEIQAQTSAFTYQGRLTDFSGPANGIYDLRFAIYDADTGGSAVVGPITNSLVVVTSGLFTTTLDFGASGFDGSDRWLEIGVVTNGGGVFTTLSPRQPISSAPYAIQAANAMTVDMGTISNPGFLGTTTPAPLQFQVNNEVGWRLENSTVYPVPNLVGGYSGNTIDDRCYGAVIAGGGSSIYPNTIGIANVSCIGGGLENKLADYSAASAIVGGGFNDIGIYSEYSCIGGGYDNSISSNSWEVTIAGGGWNNIGSSSDYSLISGGRLNGISSNAPFATIAGGLQNNVGPYATNAFAAGHRAKANYPGDFVWADSTDADFASTADNQFLIRASGGVGIGTASPQNPLHIYTPVGMDCSIRMVSGRSWGLILNMSPSSLFTITNGGKSCLSIEPGGNVGIGTNNPSQKLHVVGNILATGTVTGSSDRNVKQNFAKVDPQEILAKVAGLPITTWQYKADQDGERHLGPMAQDFYGAFHVGMDDKHISMVDADGVALAAIQGLNRKVEAGDQRSEFGIRKSQVRIRKLEAENAELKQQLNQLIRTVNQLSQEIHGGAR